MKGEGNKLDLIEKISKILIEEVYIIKVFDIYIVLREWDVIIYFWVDYVLLKKRYMKKEECVRLILYFKFFLVMDIGERRKL